MHRGNRQRLQISPPSPLPKSRSRYICQHAIGSQTEYPWSLWNNLVSKIGDSVSLRFPLSYILQASCQKPLFQQYYLDNFLSSVSIHFLMLYAFFFPPHLYILSSSLVLFLDSWWPFILPSHLEACICWNQCHFFLFEVDLASIIP